MYENRVRQKKHSRAFKADIERGFFVTGVSLRKLHFQKQKMRIRLLQREGREEGGGGVIKNTAHLELLH